MNGDLDCSQYTKNCNWNQHISPPQHSRILSSRHAFTATPQPAHPASFPQHRTAKPKKINLHDQISSLMSITIFIKHKRAYWLSQKCFKALPNERNIFVNLPSKIYFSQITRIKFKVLDFDIFHLLDPDEQCNEK